MMQVVIVVDPSRNVLSLGKPEIEFGRKKATCRCDEAMERPGDPRALVMTGKAVGIV